MGVTDLIKLQNPGEVVILAKSATFAYKSSSVHAFNEWRGAVVTWICVRSRDVQKQLVRMSLSVAEVESGSSVCVQHKWVQKI